MTRPWHICAAFVACLTVVLATMGWLTHAVVRLERAQQQTQRQAEVEESVRLALWRMDLALSPLLAQENGRTYFAYSSFYPALRAYNRMFEEMQPGEVLIPSPLLTQSSDRVRLHFQIAPDGTLSSPQIPTGQWRALAAEYYALSPEKIAADGEQLQTLAGLVDRQALLALLPPPESVLLPTEGAQVVLEQPDKLPLEAPRAISERNPLQVFDNNKTTPPAKPVADQPKPAPPDNPPPRDNTDRNAQQFRDNNKFNNPLKSPDDNQKQQVKLGQSNDPEFQVLRNNSEMDARNLLTNKALNESLKQQAELPESVQFQKSSRNPNRQPRPQPQSTQSSNSASASQPVQAKDAAGPQEQNSPQQSQTSAPAKQAQPPDEQPQSAPSQADVQSSRQQSQIAAPPQTEPSGQQQSATEPQAQVAVQSPAPLQPPPSAVIVQPEIPPATRVQEIAPPPEVNLGLLKPVWIGDQLLLMRRVTVNGQCYLQGCWLDWPNISQWLRGTVEDLLPNAALAPVHYDSAGNQTHVLAALPVKLLPGQMPFEAETTTSPLRLSLWIAWGCVIIAAIAVAVLLLGAVALSERRGAFVSAVTHELRTPLTTFRMYTQMLAEGMVPDEQKRTRYLNTLRIEADRLSHLVENVLAYARLERGRAAGRVETLACNDLLARVNERLTERAAQAGMKLQLKAYETLSPLNVRTDTSAVEQILFNLVDNACKYATALPEPTVCIWAQRDGDRAAIRVLDSGPGITRTEARRLFRPFSKSARDAANSAPGVGLGLALSRRLAREMGGDLQIDHSIPGGACFVLTLPLA